MLEGLSLVGKIMWESMIGTIHIIFGIFGLFGLPVWWIMAIVAVLTALPIIIACCRKRRNYRCSQIHSARKS